MGAQKIVYLLTRFPFSIGESYFEDEFECLTEQGADVYMVLPNYQPKNFNKESYYEKYLSRTKVFNTELTAWDKIKGIRYLFSKEIWSELHAITTFLQIPVSGIVIKTMIDCYLRARKFEKYFDQYLENLLKENESVILYSYWCTEYMLSLLWLKKKYKNIKVFSKMHAWDIYFERNKKGYLPFRKKIFEEVDSFFMVSNQGRNFLLNKFPTLDPNKFITSYLGVIEAKNIPQKSSKEPFTILSLSFVNRVKRLERLVFALEKMRHPIRWIHIGDGAAEYEIFKKIIQEKLGANPSVECILKGGMSKHKVMEFLDNHYIDLIINCSETEGLPVSLMEAMARGIPAAAPAVGGIPEIVENHITGILLNEVTSPEEVVEAIMYFYQLPENEMAAYRKNAYHLWKEKFNAKINYSRNYRMIASK
jgi:glycosyltransferase involved in cell wall biosynthesis